MKNLSIGARLSTGFALILLLLVGICIQGLFSLKSADRATQEITERSLAKERMISDWSRNIHAGSTRTTAIVKSSDPNLATFFAPSAAESTRVSGQLQDRIEPLLEAAEEKQLWTEIKKARADYLSGRDGVTKAKAADQAEEAERVFTQQYLPATARYIELVQRLLDLQRASIDASAKHVHDASHTAAITTIVTGLIALVIGVLAAWRLTRGITRPLAQAVQVARAVAANDLTSRVQVHSQDETGQLLQALHDMNASLSQVVAHVRTGAEGIATASNQIDAGNQDLSARTEEQASSLQQTAASMEQLTGTVRQNADNARQASQLATGAAQTAVQGGEVVAGVVQTMDAIHDASRRIADIIGVIDGIAFQTNILALNAAVEAARAGEQGRGFAVVAGEVRQLAQRSAAAAKDIKGLIQDSVARVEQGSHQVGEAGRTMQAIVDSVQRVSDLVAEITAASQEQSSGIEQVHQAVTQMDQVTQQNAALVEESTAATGALKAQAAQLAAAVSVFRVNGAAAAPVRASAAPVRATVPAPARTPPPTTARPAPVRKALAPAPAAAGAARGADDDWESF